MTTLLRPDICVIGAGSAGLSLAAGAAAFGVSVVLIEKGEMGGDCLNYGCVPSKALLAAAKHAHAVREAPAFGVMAAPDFSVSFAKAQDHVRATIAAIAPNDSQERFVALGVTVLRETARFIGPNTVEAGEHRIRARRFVIATGSSPRVPEIPGLDAVPFFTNETLFANRNRPNHLVIIGGGPIGMEMAQAHCRLGSKVTVIEGSVALSKDDPEMAAIVVDRLRAEGVTILEHAKVTRVEKGAARGIAAICQTEGGQEQRVEGSHLLLAVGRAPHLEGLGLRQAGIAHSDRGVKVDANLRTTNRRVYAIGDAAGSLQFTHVAGYHASLALRAILFRLPAKPDTGIIPWATYTDPELAHVGMDEKQARAGLKKFSVLRWPFHENDRAQAERTTIGHVKVIADRKGRVRGVTIVGAHAGELIAFWALAIANRMTLRQIMAAVLPYPTLSEAGRRAIVAHYAPYARKPFVRWLVGFLQKFG